MPARGEQAQFSVTTRPKAQSKKKLSAFLFFFNHKNAMVLNLNPHALIMRKASGSIGNVVQKNNAQSSAAISETGRAHISSTLIVG